MDKKALVERVAQRLELEQRFVERVIEATFEEIFESIKQGESVSLRNVGTFYVNPKREQWVFKFSPSQKWRAALGWSSTYKGD